MKKRITLIISDIDKAFAFEWTASYLNKDLFSLHFILMNAGDSVLERFLRDLQIPVDRITYRGKSDLPFAIWKCIRILKKQKTEIIHAHLFDASIVGLIASKIVGVKKRIYTRHHATSHHDYHPNAVKYDKLCNYLATDIVATSENVKKVLTEREHVSPSKIHLIHHGFDLAAFDNVDPESVKGLQKKYNLEKKPYPVIGSISRYLELKGVQYVIPAFKKLLTTYPDALLILANADGAYKPEIKKLLKSLPQKNYMELPFENNLYALYKLFDVFVHAPINEHNEAFGQTYVEALASGVPSVFTLSGVASEFIVNRKNALVVDYKNSEAIYEAIALILNDASLRESLIKSGKESVRELFGLQKMISGFEKLYLTENNS